MGNASNPIINRLGKNQFWKNHWYADTFNQNLHQDKVLKTLIKFYLKSGLSFKKSPFYSNYWYNFKLKKSLEFLNRQNSNFFRRFFYNNSFLGHHGGAVDKYYVNGWVSSTGGSINDNNWRIYMGNGDVSSDTYSFYMNNALSAGPNNGGAGSPAGLSIGASYFNWIPSVGEFSTAEFSFVAMYNRVLSTTEMTQNYNAIKSRFNL